MPKRLALVLLTATSLLLPGCGSLLPDALISNILQELSPQTKSEIQSAVSRFLELDPEAQTEVASADPQFAGYLRTQSTQPAEQRQRNLTNYCQQHPEVTKQLDHRRQELGSYYEANEAELVEVVDTWTSLDAEDWDAQSQQARQERGAWKQKLDQLRRRGDYLPAGKSLSRSQGKAPNRPATSCDPCAGGYAAGPDDDGYDDGYVNGRYDGGYADGRHQDENDDRYYAGSEYDEYGSDYEMEPEDYQQLADEIESCLDLPPEQQRPRMRQIRERYAGWFNQRQAMPAQARWQGPPPRGVQVVHVTVIGKPRSGGYGQNGYPGTGEAWPQSGGVCCRPSPYPSTRPTPVPTPVPTPRPSCGCNDDDGRIG